MEKTKRLISVLLCAVLLFSVTGVTAFADGEETPNYYLKYKHYTYFGDSVAAGVAVGTEMDDMYARSGFMRIQNCYTDLVADGIGYPDYEFNYIFDETQPFGYRVYSEVSPSANVGVRVGDLRMLLEQCMVLDGKMNEEDAYLMTGDTYFDKYGSNYLSYFDYYTWKNIPRSYQVLPTVVDSDLFTIGLGSNDIFTCPVTMMLEDENFMNVIMNNGIAIDLSSEDKGFASIQENLSKIYELICTNAETVKTFFEYSKEGLADIYNNYQGIIDAIRALNEKDADILLVGLYNPFRGLKLMPNSPTSLFCDTMSSFTALVNDFIAEIANNNDGVYYVDVSDTESLEMKNVESVMGGNMWQIFTDIHPTLEGHRYMADQVLSKLEQINTCTHEHTYVIHAEKVHFFNWIGYSGDVYCADCGEIVEYGKIETYHFGSFIFPRLTVRSFVNNALTSIFGALEKAFSVK